jgi:PPE-repeat protein
VAIGLVIAGGAQSGAALASGAGGAAGSLLSTGGGGPATGVLAGHVEAGATTSAALGKAGGVGALSVPPSWTATPPARPLVSVPNITLADEPIRAGMPPAMWSALPMAQMAGRGAAPRARVTNAHEGYERANETN